eukprot:15985-Hanusia_phi.AAC.2
MITEWPGVSPPSPGPPHDPVASDTDPESPPSIPGCTVSVRPIFPPSHPGVTRAASGSLHTGQAPSDPPSPCDARIH